MSFVGQRDARATLADRLAAPFGRFLAIEAASTILLLLAAVVALAWANSAWSASYARFWHTELSLSLGGAELSLSLEEWVKLATVLGAAVLARTLPRS